MGIMSPAFREINYGRITQLKERNLSDSTIASIINDENGTSLTAEKVSGYLEITSIASKKMLVTKKTMDVLTKKKSEPDYSVNY